jgi:hypothetical protein
MLLYGGKILNNRIADDKYYTSPELAKYCWNKTIEIIGKNNISEIIEPSSGNGVFYKLGCHFGYDISPEYTDNHIITGDFLRQEIVYLYGRLCIGNPPYGEHMNLAKKFYNKCCEIGDYVAFILPISQLNNTSSMYKFNLVYSEDLGVQSYSGRELHCCFNIYRRPEDGEENKKQTIKSNVIKIFRQDSKGYSNRPFDIRMCYWGDGTCGKILNDNETYSAEYKILITDESRRQEIKNFIIDFDWKNYKNSIASKKIQQFHIVDAVNKYLG